MADYVHQIAGKENLRIRRFLLGLAVATTLFAALVLLAILTADRWLVLVSHEAERRFVRPYIEVAESSVLHDGDALLQTYVSQLAEKLAAQLDLDHSLHIDIRVVEGNTVNAFATLGAHLYVFEGLIAEIDSENGLALILAHEIAHAKNRDPLLSAGRGMLIALTLSAMTGGGFDSTSLNTVSDLLLNSYTREQEEKADHLALEAVHRHYGHVGGATDPFKNLSALPTQVDTPELLSSHPNLNKRIAYLEALTREQNWTMGETTPLPVEVLSAIDDR